MVVALYNLKSRGEDSKKLNVLNLIYEIKKFLQRYKKILHLVNTIVLYIIKETWAPLLFLLSTREK